MTWVEVFTVMLVCHLAGDFLLQTSWQAEHKHGGLGRDAVCRRALLTHVGAYTLPFLPALAWVWHHHGAGRALAGLLIVSGTHLAIDDGRIVTGWMSGVMHTRPAEGDMLTVAVDQSFHAIALFAAALACAA